MNMKFLWVGGILVIIAAIIFYTTKNDREAVADAPSVIAGTCSSDAECPYKHYCYMKTGQTTGGACITNY